MRFTDASHLLRRSERILLDEEGHRGFHSGDEELSNRIRHPIREAMKICERVGRFSYCDGEVMAYFNNRAVHASLFFFLFSSAVAYLCSRRKIPARARPNAS